MLEEFFTGNVYAYLLVFTRVGTILMLLPGVGENLIPIPSRLAFALLFTLIIQPAIESSLPPMPEEILGMTELLFREIAIGLLIGSLSRILIYALHLAGQIIAFMSGLGFASAVDPGQGIQGALIAAFLNMLGIAMIFATDIHHVLLRSVAESYSLFAPGAVLPLGDFAELAARETSAIWRVAVGLSLPFLFFGLVVYLAQGILNRLMPQLHIFFVLVPLQILIAFFIVGAVLPSMFHVFLAIYEDHAVQFLAPR